MIAEWFHIRRIGHSTIAALCVLRATLSVTVPFLVKGGTVQNVVDVPTAQLDRSIRRSTLPEMVRDVCAGFNDVPFTINDFVAAARGLGVSDHRDVSAMLRHLAMITSVSERSA